LDFTERSRKHGRIVGLGFHAPRLEAVLQAMIVHGVLKR